MTLEEQTFSISITRWQDSERALRGIRQQVFIDEQNVPEKLEWDEHDHAATHILVEDHNDLPIATARVLANGHIGRMAVLRSCRHQGVGKAMLKVILAYCREKNLQPYLHAQTHALGFYEKMGFKISGDEFLDAGIPHRRMMIEV